jgi:ubiquinone/menaquinone biosynthesis C-methylase UbiE
MSEHRKFDPAHLAKLNDPSRLMDIPVGEIWPLLGLSAPEVMVEIGAGTGFFSIPFSGLLRAEGRLYACDISDVMLEWIRIEVAPSHPRIIPVKMDESSVPLDSSIADLVYMITLHHELEDPKAMLKECRRLLKREGKLLIIDWKKQAMDEGPPLRIRCTPDEVVSQLEDSGFKAVVIHDVLKKHFCITSEKNES